MEKFDFSIGEGLTFIWNHTTDEPNLQHCKVSKVESTGIWVVFDNDPEREDFVTYVDMNLFIRDGNNIPEGTKALWIDEKIKKCLRLSV